MTRNKFGTTIPPKSYTIALWDLGGESWKERKYEEIDNKETINKLQKALIQSGKG